MSSSKSRSSFLRAAATLGAVACVPPPAGAVDASPRAKPVSHALVLSGGGARGAYEAGIVTALASRAGVSDGEPLAPYGMVCGTSIGAMNAWFVATGQYGALAKAWETVASENIFELKSKYVTLNKPHRFIGERVRAAIRLATGLTKNETGIARSQPVLDWMNRHIDPKIPVLIPMIWAVTNLTTQSPEYFYRLPPTLEGSVSERILRTLRFTLGNDVVVREASDAMLHRALLASAAIPVVFDPVTLEMVDGSKGQYVDGGLASNSSVMIARTAARTIHVIFVEPRSRNEQYADAIDVVIGSYETMQRMMLESEMRDVYFQSLGKRSLVDLGPRVMSELERSSPEMHPFLRDLPIVKLAYMRPKSSLPAGFASFDEQPKIDASFAIGVADGANPFAAYDREHFRV